MRKAIYVTEISVKDPDTKNMIDMVVYKHENGGMFAIDSSFIDQCTDDDTYPVIPDPFSANGVEQQGATWLMLVEDDQMSDFIESVDLPQDLGF